LSLVFLVRHAAPALYYVGLFDISVLAIFRSVRFIHLNSEVLVFRYEGTNVKILSDASMFNNSGLGSGYAANLHADPGAALEMLNRQTFSTV
jgi:hypothetical protein